MTTPKPPPVDLQDFLDELADEQELERLSKLKHEDLLDEMKKEGLDPQRGRAAVRRALDGAKAGAAEPAAPPGKVLSLDKAREKRKAPVVGITLAAAAAVLLTLGVVKRDELQAWLVPGAESTTPGGPPMPSEETPQQKAEKIRKDAYVDVAKGYYGEATDELDEAKALDPGGEDNLRVQSARGTILAHKREHRGYAKPPVGPGERPLPKGPPKPKAP